MEMSSLTFYPQIGSQLWFPLKGFIIFDRLLLAAVSINGLKTFEMGNNLKIFTILRSAL